MPARQPWSEARRSHHFNGPVRTAPELSFLPPDVAARLMEQARVRTVSRGFHIFEAGGCWPGLPILLEGLGRIVLSSPSGHEQFLDLVGPGLCPWWEEALAGHCPSATLETVGRAVVAELPHKGIEEYLAEHPETWSILASSWAGDYRRIREQVSGLRAPTVPRRLAATLLYVLEHFAGPCDGLLRPDVSRTDLARLSGTTQETTSRVLAAWESAGYIHRCGRALTVLDREALREVADGESHAQPCPLAH